MANIYKVHNGCIYTLNRYGGQERAYFHPSSGGDAIFVDYNPNLDLLVVTTERGIIGIYDTHGGQRRSFGVTDAVMARWQGDEIYIQLKNGRSFLYDRFGGKLRTF